MNRVLKLSFVCCCYWLLLLLLLPANPPRLTLTSALIYTSRNECVSTATSYEVKYLADTFEIKEDIHFYTLSPVQNCYFYALNFTLTGVRMSYREGKALQISVQEFDKRVIAIRPLDGSYLQPKQSYKIEFWARKSIRAVDEGLVFKVYRDLYTMKMNWYSIVKIGPANCGKVYICINSLRSVQTLTIIAVHPPTHQLLCPGEITKPKAVENGQYLRTECQYTYPVKVNAMHFSVTDFLILDYNGMVDNRTPHHFWMATPKDEFGLINFEMGQQFLMIKRIYSLLLLTINLKPFHVIFYALPNDQVREPVVRGGVCYLNFQNINFQLDEETVYRGYLRCLLHQGFMIERTSDSWSLQYASEGLFEKLLGKFQVFSMSTKYYRNAIEGDADALAALAKRIEDVTRIPVNRPWRKAAAFFTMLGAIGPGYARATYTRFLDNNGPTLEHTSASFQHWITEHSQKLGLKVTYLLEVIDTWTMAEGYPVITVEVVANRTVCLEHYNVGVYFRSYLVPVQVDSNFPNTVHSKTIWTNPRNTTANCVTVWSRLYPYLINSYFGMAGRVHYDPVNWQIWATELMKASVREGLGPMRKVALVTDALFFAGRRQLSYSIALRFLFAMQAEDSEEAWRNFDRTLQSLDARMRYTGVYSLFKKTIAGVAEKYFNTSGVSARASETAHKWSCMMGNPVCLTETEKTVRETLNDHRVRHLPEILCGGMRRLRFEKLRALILTMDRPDWREPEFYVQMMLCAEEPRVLRELLHHLFFHNSWQFRQKKLGEMVLRLIRVSKSGSDAVFYYLNHDPVGMVDRLGFENMLLVVEELAVYMKENWWFMGLLRRLRVKGIVWEELVRREGQIRRVMKENKRWYNTQYEDVRKFFMKGYGRELRKFEKELPEVLMARGVLKY